MRSSDWSADVCSSDLDVRSLPFIDQTLTGTLPLEWAPVRMVSDDPIKGVGKAPRGALLAAALHHAIGEPQSETRLVPGYFVPGRAGVDALGALAARGVDLGVFTHAFQPTRSEERRVAQVVVRTGRSWGSP